MSFEAVATTRLIMKNHGKKKRRRRRRETEHHRGPRGFYCGHAVCDCVCLRGNPSPRELEIISARHISRTRTFIINSFGIPDFHFLFLFPAHYTTMLFFFIQHYLFVFPINPAAADFVILLLLRDRKSERERVRLSLARNYGQNNIFELPLISARGLRVNSLRKINKSVCKAL